MYAHAQAPVRIGIAGGGTDLPAWTATRPGLCLSLAVASYTHAIAISRPDGRVVASYRQRDDSSSATEIANGLIRETALAHGWQDGFEVHTLAEMSSRGSGLGVSSSIAVSLAACFARLAAMRDGIKVDPRWQDGGEEGFRQSAARDAWTVEIERLRRPIGRQDHMAAAYGGLRLYRFEGANAVVERTFSKEDAMWVAEHLALVELPEGHDSRSILAHATDCNILAIAALALQPALSAIETHDPLALGRALLHGQDSKDKIPGATPPWLAQTLDKINACPGVTGCKVAGAGGGGHVVVAIEHKQRLDAITAATGLRVTTVKPDFDGVRSEGWV